jgi:hypothetical protein
MPPINMLVNVIAREQLLFIWPSRASALLKSVAEAGGDRLVHGSS